MGKAVLTVVAAVVACLVVVAHAGVIEDRLAHPSAATTDLAEGSAAGKPSRAKRSLPVDPSCKGVHSRKIWHKLCYVCEDCDNVFRQDGFQAKCRKDCFDTQTFSDCLVVLEKDVKWYQAMATSIRGS